MRHYLEPVSLEDVWLKRTFPLIKALELSGRGSDLNRQPLSCVVLLAFAAIPLMPLWGLLGLFTYALFKQIYLQQDTPMPEERVMQAALANAPIMSA